MQALFFTLYIVLYINLRSALHTALHKGKNIRFFISKKMPADRYIRLCGLQTLCSVCLIRGFLWEAEAPARCL